MRKGDLVKYRKYPYHTYKIYRIKEATNTHITLIPALGYTNNGMKEVPVGIMKIPELFSFLTMEEEKEFKELEFKNAWYKACVELDRLEEKLEKLNKETDSHRIHGEISICLNKIHKQFDRIENENTN